MFEQLEIMRMAREMSVHAAHRQAVVSQNVANADTPGYRALDTPSFSEMYQRSGPTTEMRATRPGHTVPEERRSSGMAFVDTAAEASPNGNTVSLEEQMVKAATAKRDHDLSLAIYRTSLDILRTSLGRGR